MNKIIEALNENLKVIYRKAVDADAALNSLQHAGKGKFDSIFAAESGFETRSKRFVPYVEELAGEIAGVASAEQDMKDAEQDHINTALPSIVKKIQLMLNTLEQFKKTLK